MTDNPYTMTRAQRTQLVERLLPLYRERFDLRNKHVAWAELPGKSPELSEYSPEVLRFYTRACAHFGLLQDFEEQGDGFVLKGLTRAGLERIGAKNSSMVRFIALFCGLHAGRAFGKVFCQGPVGRGKSCPAGRDIMEKERRA